MHALSLFHFIYEFIHFENDILKWLIYEEGNPNYQTLAILSFAY